MPLKKSTERSKTCPPSRLPRIAAVASGVIQFSRPIWSSGPQGLRETFTPSRSSSGSNTNSSRFPHTRRSPRRHRSRRAYAVRRRTGSGHALGERPAPVSDAFPGWFGARPVSSPGSITGATNRQDVDRERRLEKGELVSTSLGKSTADAGSVSVAPTPLADAFSSLVPHDGIELRGGYARVGDQTLHYVEAGDGPLVVLLHGFPEFWFGWRLQIAPLAAAGFRVVVPDTRGYNLSSKPEGFEAYAVDLLADDISALIGELDAESALLVGHDWGGSIAWTVAMNHPEVVDRLVILNAAHPRKLNEGLKHPRQLLRSWYFFFFQFPGLPEHRARRRHWRFFKRFLRDARPPYTAQEIDRYVEAWSQPRAAKTMIDYYRAAVRLGSKQELRPVSAPTLVIWGQRDRYLGPKLAEPHHDDVPNLDRVERLPNASHWVHHDEAERVNDLLVDFFAPARESEDGR